MKFGSRTAGTLTAIALLLGASVASAANPWYSEIHDGFDDDISPNGGQNDGPGNEHPEAIVVKDGEDTYVVSLYMNTYTEGNGNYDCWCSSTKFSPGQAPELVAREQLTDYNSGERQCNAPNMDVAYMGDDAYIGWAFGSDYNNANPRTYFRVMDKMCNQIVSENLLISTNANNNEGAPEITMMKVDGDTVHWGVAYGSTNNNDASRFRPVAMTVSNGDISFDKGPDKAIIAPANIPRPSQAHAPGSDYLLHCQARGNNRPPEMGLQCAYVNGITGEIMWKEYIRQSDPGNKSYANQASVAYLGDNKYAVLLLESTGQGKNNNIKGATITELHVISANENGMQKLAKIREVGAYQAHSSVCAGPYGDEGKMGIAVIDASITGIGPTTLDIATFDMNSNHLDFDSNSNRWIINPYDGDSGHAQNIYGGNPNNQGSGHPECLGTMQNPSFGMEVGFMPEVETFFVVPHVASKSAEEKLGMYLGVVPGKVVKATPPGAPTNDGTPTKNTQPQGGGDDPIDEPGNGGPGTPGTASLGEAGTASGCTVSEAGSSDDMNGLALLALGLGFIGLARRREEV
jgi:MYXO-CTERM domain-containing protein